MEMRAAALIIVLIIALMAVVESSPGLGNNRRPPPYVNRLPPPRPRFRRSPEPQPEPQGSLSITGQKNLHDPERRPSYNGDHQQEISQKSSGQRLDPNVLASFRFRGAAESEPKEDINHQE